MDWLTGTAQWPFKDFSTPLRPENPVPYVNQKGVVERDFTPKESYYLMQSYWTTRPMSHIYGHSWPERWGEAGESKMIKVYSNCEEAELFVDGVSMGKRRRNSQDFPAAGLRWNVPLQYGAHRVWVVAQQGKTIVRDSIQFKYVPSQWGKPVKLQLTKKTEKAGRVIMEAKLVDAAGNTCLDNSSWIRFTHAGRGNLVVDQGTARGSSLVQLYNGRAEITVIPEQGGGILSAMVNGIDPAFIQF
jgi:beta-galactosidase